MTAWRLIRPLATVSLAALVAGCAVGPDFLRPDAPAAKAYTPEPLPAATASTDVAGGTAQRFVMDRDIPGQWWTLFHSPALNTLVEQALKANPDLDAAQAALRQAQENLYAQQGSFYPSVNANFAQTRQKTAGALTGQTGSPPPFNLTTASLSVSYTADVFGGIDRQVESLAAQAENQRFQLEAAYLTLTSNLVAAAIQEASLRGQITATEEIITAESRQLDVLRQQFELGGASKAAVLAQEATLAQTRAGLPPLQRQLAQQRNRLTALVGRFPSDEVAQRFDLASLTLPQDLPLSLPSKLVEQRPDVRAAEAQVHQTSAEIGVAIANMLPQFTITGQYGRGANSIGDLFSPGGAIWSLGGAILQPIFRGGELLHQKRAAVAAFDKASAQYRGVVLNAFQNVADALRAVESDADALRAQAAAEQSAAGSFEISRTQFQLGAITYTALLDSERTYLEARVNVVQAQANRYADTAALFQALGGGWWNRTDVAEDAGTAPAPVTASTPVPGTPRP